MKVAIVSTGEELLSGETVDTNSAWLAAAVRERGAMVRRMLTTGDDLQGIVWALEQAATRELRIQVPHRTHQLVVCGLVRRQPAQAALAQHVLHRPPLPTPAQLGPPC